MSAAETKTDSQIFDQINALRENLSRVILGKNEVVDQVVLGLISGESVLIEDVPGVGKTTLAKALALSVQLDFQRVQCTPDLLPADIFGFSILNPQDGSFSFRPGPIFCNILLVDEINRASPRTQSALLEAMAERQVTIEGKLHKLDPPFVVLATQNPSSHQGTFPLPESQLDRFLLQISIDYPSAENEVDILYSQASANPLDDLLPVLTRDQVVASQKHVQTIHVEKSVAEYMIRIVNQTRSDERIVLGCSPRGSLMLFRAAQGMAFMSGRDFVLPDDVQSVAPFVLSHRIELERGFERNLKKAQNLVRDVVDKVPVPV
ncbi:MAG: MoxR family ATPase [Planctomycetota bacterium]|nr:MoxR family ATPase [Planctomycetota bacterium]